MHNPSRDCFQLPGWDLSQRLTTLGIGHADDCPLSFVSSYMAAQHRYSERACASHFSGEYVFLFKQVCRVQAGGMNSKCEPM